VVGPAEIYRLGLTDEEARGTFHAAIQASDLCLLISHLKDIGEADPDAISTTSALGFVDRNKGVRCPNPDNSRNILKGKSVFHERIPSKSQLVIKPFCFDSIDLFSGLFFLSRVYFCC
jgi:hypothetical protein